MNKIIQTDKLANKIVDNDYKNSKNKNPFTQAAEKAKELLSHTYNSTTGKFDNFDGQTLPATEAVKVNEFWDKNFQDQKQDDYLKKLDHYGIEESKVKHPNYPKVSNQPILNNNIANKMTPAQRKKQNYLKTWGIKDGPHNPDLRNIIRKAVNEADEEKKNNPTINKYKTFKENQKKQLEEKKLNQHMEREYGDRAMGQYMRKKEYENKKAGKAPYDNFSTSDIIVAEDLKDKAAKKLKALQETQRRIPKTETSLNNYINYKEVLDREPIQPMPSLEEYMAARAPKEDAGITGIRNVQGMKNLVEYSDKAFNLNNSKGIGPFISGEDD